MLGSGKSSKSARVQTLIGAETELHGDIYFHGGIHVDGRIKGNVVADDGSASFLNLSETGSVEGEVRVPNITLNGTVKGDVHASEKVELASHARVIGNVFYNLIEMAIGAEVNGNLVHRSESSEPSPVVPLDLKENV
ncbi:MAG: polymer-forming cytoskeletal protein [Gammaproteobacteria bacterium]|nr:MAG: polymer-forming cytoskeletal protein [Gammaproteobacteria bacterium]